MKAALVVAKLERMIERFDSVTDGLAYQAEVDAEMAKNPGGKNPTAVAMGKRGGTANAVSPRHYIRSLSAAERSELARRAANARWGNR